MDEGRTDQLVFFAFDLLFLNGESIAHLPLIERKEGLKRLFRKEISGLRYSEHVAGDGPRFRQHACQLGLEGATSKRPERPYAPGDRGIWVKSKCQILSSVNTQSSPLVGGVNWRVPVFAMSPISEYEPVRGSNQYARTPLPAIDLRSTVVGSPEAM